MKYRTYISGYVRKQGRLLQLEMCMCSCLYVLPAVLKSLNDQGREDQWYTIATWLALHPALVYSVKQLTLVIALAHQLPDRRLIGNGLGLASNNVLPHD